MTSRNARADLIIALPDPERGRALAEQRQSNAAGTHGPRRKSLRNRAVRRGTRQQLRDRRSWE